MGFLKRVTGIAAQENAYKRNARAMVKMAEDSSRASMNAAIDQARTTAEQQAQQVAREAAISKAKEVTSTPMEVADVQLEVTSTDSAAATARRKRGQFGRDYLSGVSI